MLDPLFPDILRYPSTVRPFGVMGDTLLFQDERLNVYNLQTGACTRLTIWEVYDAKDLVVDGQYIYLCGEGYGLIRLHRHNLTRDEGWRGEVPNRGVLRMLVVGS